MQETSRLQIEELKRYLEAQGENMAELEEEGKKTEEKLKKLDRRLQAARNRGRYTPSSAQASFRVGE